MAVRTSKTKVAEIVAVESSISVTPFIRAANLLTDEVDSADTGNTLSADLLTEIETYLAAHFYTFRDQQYESKTTGRASAKFQGQTGKGLDSSFYGQTAKMLDTTGYLKSLDSTGRRKVGVTWLGTEFEDLDLD